MKVLAFDGRMGASGDMLLGALLDAGADPSVLETVERDLPVEFDVGRTMRAGIEATTVTVRSTAEDGDGHGHGDGDGHDHAEGHGPHRHYREVLEIVEGLSIPEDVEETALAVVDRLGEAEAAVHGTTLEETHFHEVGADDAIADIVGAALLLSDLDPDRIVTGPVSVGGGTVAMSHGTYPVPPPAVATIAESADWQIRGGPVDRELLTPTGAAILATVAEGVESLPSMAVEAVGYGAGSADVSGHPNVLRVFVGTVEGGLRRESVTTLETTVDDVTPEVLGGLHETLADAGARDVSITPTTMKKGRPGHHVTVVCPDVDADRVARRLAMETGTLGIREVGAGHRWVADRRIEHAVVDVDGTSHDVDVKVATDESGTVYDVSAEYDDALAVAMATGMSLRTVQRRAEAAVRDRLGVDED